MLVTMTVMMMVMVIEALSGDDDVDYHLVSELKTFE